MINFIMDSISYKLQIEEEEKATGFLCASCLIKDNDLRKDAEAKLLNSKKCSGCGQDIEKGLRLEYIAEKINKHFGKHYKIIEKKGNPDDLVSLKDIINRFIIDNEDVVKSISEILYKLNSHNFGGNLRYKNLFDQDAIRKQTSEVLDEWNKYAFELKHSMRFTNVKAINFYRNIISYGVKRDINNEINQSPMLKIIDIGIEFYRGRRVLDDEHKKQLTLTNKEFYAPPPERATNSRMSPPGMPFLYTATDQKTCIAELHPFAGDEIAVIKLETERPLYFFDLTRAIDVKYGPLGLIHDPSAKLYAYRHLLSHLHDLIAQPFRATDISYTAIQAFAETVRHYEFKHNEKKRNFDGIIFNSTQMNGGLNYVFFGDSVTGHRVESPFGSYGVKPSVKEEPVRFYKISNIQVTTSPPIVDE
ncbi:RES domain-containing protein [Pectobacterium carotovorum]|uniref:RES family NAD+ phosphorylase n=1 Tax=Pectobacterium carotovorum TaxID=554 RepID=UPI000E75A4FA|nr:RES family NAD+ phosphorylase [Pectobacterium carotovorum]RJL47142.1 RES domain-containing protein [Pectobacterium carotovorum]